MGQQSRFHTRPVSAAVRAALPCLLGAGLLAAPWAQAATITVNSPADPGTAGDGHCTLREAIANANDTTSGDLGNGCSSGDPSGADTILIGALVTGTITLSGGELAITADLTINGPGAAQLAVDGNANSRVFNIAANQTVAIDALTIQNGSASGSGGGIYAGAYSGLTLTNSTVSGNSVGSGYYQSGSSSGGGISAATATLNSSTVWGNGAGQGGGISAGNATLTDSTVAGNWASGSGGGIWAGNATLTDSTVSGNLTLVFGGGIWAGNATLTDSTVSGNYGGIGGGIRASNATLTNSTVSGNSVTYGLGYYGSSSGGGIDAETATLTNSTVSGNWATSPDFSGSQGGGITAATATLTNSTVSANSVGSGYHSSSSGGGIAAATATLTNSTVSGNSATSWAYGSSMGGGISAATAILTNSTVSGNSVTSGYYGFRSGGGVSAGNATLTNSLIANSTGGGDCFGFVYASHTLIADGTCGISDGVNGNIVGDPVLGPLANNGCLTPAGAPDSAACVQTHALLTGSPAIDTGDNAVCSAAPVNGEDQRGFPRDDGACDIGAYEARPDANLNDQLADNPPISAQTYVPGATCPVPGECNAGVFSFTATFCNSGGGTLAGLTSQTVTLAGVGSDPRLVSRHRDGSPVAGGAGSEQDFALGTLALGQCEDITFAIGLAQRKRFTFFVDIFGSSFSSPP